MKRKNSSDYTIERVYNFILNCGGIASGSAIAKYNCISESYAQQCAREAIRRYDDIESVSGAGYRKKGVTYSYIISANLYSHDVNDYIYHWDGPVFKRLSSCEKARDVWCMWTPPEKEVKEQADVWFKDNPEDWLELEIGLWDYGGDDVEWYSKVVARRTGEV